MNPVCYDDSTDERMPQIRSSDTLSGELIQQLIESGFATVPGSLFGRGFSQLSPMTK
jgi:hypothetical protein